jgi:hypothetical protein
MAAPDYPWDRMISFPVPTAVGRRGKAGPLNPNWVNMPRQSLTDKADQTTTSRMGSSACG